MPPQGPRVQGQKCNVARPVHVSISCTKFGSISSNGYRRDSVMDDLTPSSHLFLSFAEVYHDSSEVYRQIYGSKSHFTAPLTHRPKT